MFFVYLKNTRGTWSAEKWRERSVQINGKIVSPAHAVELKNDEITLPLSVLERLYPPPKEESDAQKP